MSKLKFVKAIFQKSFKSWRPNRSAHIDRMTTTYGESFNQNYQQMNVTNFIGGKFIDSQASTFIDVINPATQQVVSRAPLTTYEEFKEAVQAAKKAFTSWRNTPVTTRQRIMFKLRELIQRDIDKLAMNITIEQGRTLKGAQDDVLRGLEAVENACGMSSLQMGLFNPNALSGIDTYSVREPLGVCAGICPINFSPMSPLRMFPIAVTCGNTFVLRPCEKNPGASMILAALAKEAGLPDGVLNIVHGNTEIADYICDDPDIKAMTTMGSDVVGMHIYARAATKGKHVQSNSQGKNYAIIMPDANMDATLNALVSAGFGSAGQRSMALNIAIFVGGSLPWEEKLLERAKALELNAGTVPEADIGPVISKEVQDHISTLVQMGVNSGARLLLDGRNALVPGYENGNFVGPTILCDVTVNMDCYKEEIFGPVLICMQADSLEEAIIVVNSDKPVNGASIHTACRFSARNFQNKIEATLVGINVPVPVLLRPSSFSRSETSFSGDISFSGNTGVQFYTQVKTVVEQWSDLPTPGSPSALFPSSDTDMAGQAVSSALHHRSDMDSPSLRLSPSSDDDSPSEGVMQPALMDPGSNQGSYTNSSSQWNRNRPTTSQRVETMTSSERMYNLTPQRHVSMLSMSQRTEEPGMVLTSEQLSMSISHRNSDVGPTSQLTNAGPSTSERVFILPTCQRNIGMQPTERIYMPASSIYTETGFLSADQGLSMTTPSSRQMQG
ncbi:hypothetical protein ACFE04_020991 [Oxalis oulophora]